jgi:fumarylacetoacetase
VSLDETHDPAATSWLESANGHPDFPIQNLPVGVFSPPGGSPRIGIAIGTHVLDVPAALAARHLPGIDPDVAEALRADTLNLFLAMGGAARRALRHAAFRLLNSTNADTGGVKLFEAADCVLHLPARIGDYTDFYVGIHHATYVGRVFRPDNPLLANYKHVPIGYHGRASSVRASGVAVRRPRGQINPPDAAGPRYAPCERLDYELELGIWIGTGNQPGEPIGIGAAADHIAGFCLLNDWSARDIQAWEYQPLGPFLAKSFGTTISPWVITPEALAPFRMAQPPRPDGDPTPLPYLWDDRDQREGALDVELDVLLLTPAMVARGMPPYRLGLSHTRHMYWTVAQLVAHHTSGGCDLRPGDLFGSGTISAPEPSGFGSLLEVTRGGTTPVDLPSVETRRFLADGDEVVLRARCRRDGAVGIGFGECRARIAPQ